MEKEEIKTYLDTDLEFNVNGRGVVSYPAFV